MFIKRFWGSEKMAKKVMKIIDKRTCLMECRVCGQIASPTIHSGGRLHRGSWQCPNGCKFEEVNKNV